MPIGNDGPESFRRNLVVYCVLVLSGTLLNIPLAAVIEKMLGIGVGKVSIANLQIIQATVFVYLVHRYYFYGNRPVPWKAISGKRDSLSLAHFSEYVVSQVERANASPENWPSSIHPSKSELLAAVAEQFTKTNSGYVASPMKVTLSPYQRFENGEWHLAATVVDANQNTLSNLDQFRQVIVLKIPVFTQFAIRNRAMLGTMLTSELTTEVVVPFLLTIFAGLAIVLRFFFPSMFGNIVSACQLV